MKQWVVLRSAKLVWFDLAREAHAFVGWMTARVLKSGGRIGVNSADGDRAHQSASLVREAVIEEVLRDIRRRAHSGRIIA